MSKDLHLRLVFSADSLNLGTPETNPAREAAYMSGVLAEGRTRNFGFDQASRLPGNIGYLRISTFFPAEHGSGVADAAMQLLANTDALIIDLRSNTGGASSMVGHLSGYFVEERTFVGTSHSRLTNRTDSSFINPVPSNEWFRAKPLFIVISGDMFSAGEALAYTLQSLHRAVIVGERTRGGAHLTSSWTIDSHLEIRIPHQSGINVRTGTDWEGVGVAPDVLASGPKSLATAHLLALREAVLRAGLSTGELFDERKQAIARRELELKSPP